MLLNVRTLSFFLLLVAALGCSSDQPTVTKELPDLTSQENQIVGLMGQFQYDKAVKACRELIAVDGLTADRRQKFRVDLAIALLNRRQEKDLQESEQLLDKAMQSDKTDLRAKYCRALLYFNAGKTDQAKQLFSMVAQADPTDSYAIYYVGQCNFLTGDHQAALERFLEAEQLDPYLRSAYYGAFQSSQRLRDMKSARAYLQKFQKLATNPRARLAELKYTRMGPKAEVYASEAGAQQRPLPAGPLFAKAEDLPTDGTADSTWQNCQDPAALPNITVADLNGDSLSDLFIARAFAELDAPVSNAVLFQTDEGFRLNKEHVLAKVSDVNAALWGDYDNDGLTDVYLCRRGPNQLWKQHPAGQWTEIVETAQVGGGDLNTVDGACFDADHDGDLDYLLANSDGKHQLFNNNRDGTFRELAAELGFAKENSPTQQVLVADLDSDDDADLVFLNRNASHEVLFNDRFWNYRLAKGFEDFAKSPCLAATACDSDVNGQMELFTLDQDGVLQWFSDDSESWSNRRIASFDVLGSQGSIAVVDLNGDLQPEIACAFDGVWKVFDLQGKELQSSVGTNSLASFALWQQQSGPEFIGCVADGAPKIWKAGRGRHAFVRFALSGKTDKAAEMRSNASGIGVQTVARVGSQWGSIPPFRLGSGPGQSLQPMTVGLAGASQVDFLRMLWPDGVSQTELALKPGLLHEIAETQRQAGSCPLVFVWNGEQYEFIADFLGAGGIGFNLGRGDFYDPRPHECLLIPNDAFQPKDGRLIVKLGEPMEEICYFDAVRLVAYDLPPGWQMTLDERFGAAEPMPTGTPFFFDKLHLPAKAINDRGRDITREVSSVDKIAAPLDREDHRFIGRADQRSITLTFDRPLSNFENPVLLFDGWVEYAYSQTAFAAWQAGQEYVEPTVEARGADGQWTVVASRFGYPAGTPRQSTMPLDKSRLPAGTRELRISTNMQVYWDRLSIFDAQKVEQAQRIPLELKSALVDDVGFSTRTLLAQRFTTYDYGRRPPLADARHPAGFYTQLGDALELVTQRDNALAIIGPGEELHLEFEALTKNPPSGWSRRFVLEADGWCKDADLFTEDSGSVEPLPRHHDLRDETTNRRRQHLHSKYNTRFKSGY